MGKPTRDEIHRWIIAELQKRPKLFRPDVTRWFQIQYNGAPIPDYRDDEVQDACNALKAEGCLRQTRDVQDGHGCYRLEHFPEKCSLGKTRPG